MGLERLKKLCGMSFVSGGCTSDLIGDMLKTVCDEVYKDKFQNTIGIKKGTSGRRILLDAHVDEIGFAITEITKSGALKFRPVGGIDPRVLPGCEVTICGHHNLFGVIGAKPPHLLSEEERGEAVKMETLTIDAGFENPSDLISVGDFVSFRENFRELPKGFICSKALDNRMGFETVLTAMEKLSYCPHEIVVLASSGEELGCVGASGALWDLKVDCAIVVDVTFGKAPDTPEEGTFPLGSGPALCTGPNINRTMFQFLKNTAEQNKIPYTIEVAGGDAGTNAGVIQLSNEGLPVAMVSIPIRYMHTPSELGCISDMENSARLIELAVREGCGVL